MAVVIRLQRHGKRTQPHYRMVAIEKNRGPHGRPLEILGHYDPKAAKDKDKVQIKAEKIEYWLKNGAKTSPTVSSLIKKAKKSAALSSPKA
ncbi:MAG: 30S ribosomal protein S16 [Elusimicrobia bacterium]|nr:30S ribosomal protein S16 [Elusimicrobiota bacterium]